VPSSSSPRDSCSLQLRLARGIREARPRLRSGLGVVVGPAAGLWERGGEYSGKARSPERRRLYHRLRAGDLLILLQGERSSE